MDMVLLTAFGVGGATVIGSLAGFAFKKFSHRFSDIVLSFAAGVMLAAAVLGLVLPSLEYGGRFGLLITVAGIFAGAFSSPSGVDSQVTKLYFGEQTVSPFFKASKCSLINGKFIASGVSKLNPVLNNSS